MSAPDRTRDIARTPAEVPELFSARLSAGDVDGALELYDPEGAFVPEPGAAPIGGRDAIRAALEGFVAMRPTLVGELKWTQEAGDIGLVVNGWTLEGTGPDGAPIRMQGQAADVVRRGPDGGWRYLIDYPWAAT